ncbi:phage tail protein [Aquabacterium sp.]|uniref:phage tail protein n=1 Tax=Aquabacterium sp. TaxID=1872578 RepID=UPI002CDBBA68|nr:tail fiber protein [Aquabacterium sp.]HSW05947.1 tail fiber protein [Aquabacterium sp.]
MTLFKRPSIAAAVLALACACQAGAAQAQSTPYLGQVMCGAWNFAPKGWAMMNGQLLPIMQNTSLFALLGTTYGGDGQVTFALPDLRGRVAMHFGQGPGLSNRPLGDHAGSETVNLAAANLPPHAHQVVMQGSGNDATATSPAGKLPARARTPQYADPSGVVNMAASMTSSVGSGTPVDKMPPYLALNCVIAVQGTWPTAN